MNIKIRLSFISLLYCLLSIASIFATGCTAPLSVKYDAKLGAPPISLKEPVSILLVPYKDERHVKSKKIGDITSPVFGIDSTEIILDREPAEIVTDAFKEQLKLAGFNVKVADNGASAPDADILMEGSLKAFKLDIGPKDDIEIEMETRLTDLKNKNILWSGKVQEKNSRFAGTMGNTKDTVSRYIASSLAKVVKETLTETAPAIEKIKPHSVEPVKEEMILGSDGRLTLTTIPPQSQVFIDDVYYGLSPITIDIAPGVYTVSFKLTGFKNSAQKIAVRKGRITEFSAILEKE